MNSSSKYITVDEIHETRRDLYELTKNMTREERKEYHRKNVEKLAEKYPHIKESLKVG